LADHGCLCIVNDETGWHGATTALVSVAIWNFGADNVAVTRLLQFAAPESLGQHGTLVFCNRTLDLQQQLVIGIIRDWMVQKYDLAVGPTKLLHQQHLIGIFPRQTVRAEHDHQVHNAVSDRVP
jgi:hypothetical protein